MDGYTYKILHDSADRLALEAVRKQSLDSDAAGLYIKTYERALDFLVDKYNKSEHETMSFVLKNID